MTPDRRLERGHGVYGVRILGLNSVQSISAPATWETWTVLRSSFHGPGRPGMSVTDVSAQIGLSGTGEIRIDRGKREIVYATSRHMSDAELLHPALAPAAAVLAFWAGRAAIHASAVLIDGHAWAFLADREGGKSTTAALLLDMGYALLTDDMLIVEGSTAFAGPGTVDLREEAGKTLAADSIGLVGSRERWRRQTNISLPLAPLAGFVVLDWSDGSPSVHELDLSTRIQMLERQIGLPIQGDQLLTLAGLPMMRFQRQRSIADAAAGVDAMLAAIGASTS